MTTTRTPRSKRPNWFGPMHAQNELTIFILVNALDVFMTYWMLQVGGFTESNPVALWFIHRWGVKGMIYFKFAVVALVCVIAHIVSQYKPPLAKNMLTFGTLIVAAVVVYSVVLYSRHGGGLPPLPMAE
jgi:hypothetical protein